MIGFHSRLQENDDLPLWQAPALRKKPPFAIFFLNSERQSRVKLYTIRLRNAILRNDLKQCFQIKNQLQTNLFKVHAHLINC